MVTTSFFVYGDIAGSGKGWTLAVCAINRRDADTYIKAVHHGGKFLFDVKNGGTVKASCGATTTAAQAAIRAINEAHQ